LESEPVSVQVFPGNAPPTATMTLENLTTPGRQLYHAGDEWRFSASDVDDDQTAPEDMLYEWEVVFHHRDHMHPFLLPQDNLGTSGVFTIPVIGEVDHVVWYRVYLRISDSFGQETEIFRDVFPVTTQIAVGSDPPGLNLSIDAQTMALSDTLILTRVVGLETLLEAPAEQLVDDVTYTFVGWSNDAERSFTLTVPMGGGTYTALYERVLEPTATLTPTATATATGTATGTATATTTTTGTATDEPAKTATVTVTVGTPTVTPSPTVEAAPAEGAELYLPIVQ
jgi:hypothetical protein